MTDTKTIGSRGAALVLVTAGSLTLLASFWTWGSCSTTPCGGFLQSISQYSGFDLGFGFVTAGAGLMLAGIGLDALRRSGVSRIAKTAVLLAILIVLTAGGSVIWMYALPGDDKDYHGPPYVPVLVGIIGLVGLAGSLRLRRTMSPRG